MAELLGMTFVEAFKKMQDEGQVPLGVLAYDVEKDSVKVFVFGNVDPQEANAILEKLGLKAYYY